MSNPLRLGSLLALLLAAQISPARALLASQQTDHELPSFPEVQAAAASFFAALPNYRPGDLITRSQARTFLDEVQEMGWDVAGRDQILALVPADDDLFVKKLLGSAAGRKFMRQSSKYPLAYDRIEHLSRLPRADQNIQSLINGPDGYKMLQYMTETYWGKQLGRQLSNSPGGANFNAPTGRIYTAQTLVDHLERAYAAELERRAQAANAAK